MGESGSETPLAADKTERAQRRGRKGDQTNFSILALRLRFEAELSVSPSLPLTLSPID